MKADTSTKSEHNYEAERLYCPANAYVGHQPVDRHDSSLRLRQLRSEMIRVAAVQGPALDGYIVTSDDEHQVSSIPSTKLTSLDIDNYDLFVQKDTSIRTYLGIIIDVSVG